VFLLKAVTARKVFCGDEGMLSGTGLRVKVGFGESELRRVAEGYSIHILKFVVDVEWYNIIQRQGAKFLLDEGGIHDIAEVHESGVVEFLVSVVPFSIQSGDGFLATQKGDETFDEGRVRLGEGGEHPALDLEGYTSVAGEVAVEIQGV
jgi:hypothetical protein